MDRHAALAVLKIALLTAASWTVITLVHECGHLVGGWLSGATLVSCDLAPWRLPYSLHAPDPQPLVTLWCGPLIGSLAPFAAAAALRRRWAWFIADFCLLANGVYLAAAWVTGDSQLDTARLLAAGAHPATIVIFCTSTIAIGYRRFRADCVQIWSEATISRRTPDP